MVSSPSYRSIRWTFWFEQSMTLAVCVVAKPEPLAAPQKTVVEVEGG